MKNQADELRKIAAESNGLTQKFMLRQLAAGQADMMDFMTAIDERLDEADDERALLLATDKSQQKDIERLEGRGKLYDILNGLGVIIAGVMAWLFGQN